MDSKQVLVYRAEADALNDNPEYVRVGYAPSVIHVLCDEVERLQEEAQKATRRQELLEMALQESAEILKYLRGYDVIANRKQCSPLAYYQAMRVLAIVQRERQDG